MLNRAVLVQICSCAANTADLYVPYTGNEKEQDTDTAAPAERNGPTQHHEKAIHRKPTQLKVVYTCWVITLHTWHSRAAFALSNKPEVVAAAEDDDAAIGSAPTQVMGALAATTAAAATAASPLQLRHELIVSLEQRKVPSSVCVVCSPLLASVADALTTEQLL